MKTQLDTPITKQAGGALVYQIESELDAPPQVIWRKLTDIDELLRWDSMLMTLEGQIKKGGKIKLRSAISPKQTFSLKVSEFIPYEKMVWSSGMGPLFKGIRTYELRPIATGTYFKMHESFSGWMLPFMKKMLPDCDVLFGTYIKDLKNEVAATNKASS